MNRVSWHAGFLFVLAWAAVMPARAQSASEAKPPVFLYVSSWAVPRAEWPDMAKLDEHDRSAMDKLISDGTLVSYGSASVLIHQEGAPTHTEWLAADSEGSLLKALEAVYKNPGSTDSKVQGDSKHWDYFLVCPVHYIRPGKSEGGYLTGVQWTVKPGQMHAYEELLKATIVPVFDKLASDGAVNTYGLCTEDFHTGTLGATTFYFTTPDAASFDKASKAIDDSFTKNPAIEGALRNVVLGEGHRDFLDRIAYANNK